MASLQHLSNKSLVIVFAYAPTGLGHLRVTDALYHGLPAHVPAILLGSQDTSISAEYRFISIHPLFRTMFVAVQNGILQTLTTILYRMYLRNHTKIMYQQLLTILDERFELPQTMLIVATHFGLAHQIAAVKKQFEEKNKIRMILAVQVTDDTPEPIWYVPGADCVFVPSFFVKEKLSQYGKKNALPPVNFIINPYPESPYLCQELSSLQFTDKQKQLLTESQAQIHVSIPISGAAIGTLFFTKLIDTLHALSSRYHFHIVAKEAMYTKSFITNMRTREYASLSISSHDRGTVDNYEQLYRKNIISLEITKPSEQTFKALLLPKQTGGVLLLFAEPVGQQEKDNLAFLKRHKLIPTHALQTNLWTCALENKQISADEKKGLLRDAHHWRGLLLPKHALATSTFIHWCLEQGIFEAMMSFQSMKDDAHPDELGSDGVRSFWETLVSQIYYPK